MVKCGVAVWLFTLFAIALGRGGDVYPTYCDGNITLDLYFVPPTKEAAGDSLRDPHLGSWNGMRRSWSRGGKVEFRPLARVWDKERSPPKFSMSLLKIGVKRSDEE